MEKPTRSAKEARSSPPHLEKNLTYESALEQLEEILDKMNGSITLEESVGMYERADKLLHHCSQKLGEAESKIETLVKNRSGDFAIGGDGRPVTEILQEKSSASKLQTDQTAFDKDDLPF